MSGIRLDDDLDVALTAAAAGGRAVSSAVVANLVRERDQARRIAVALEQEIARLRTLVRDAAFGDADDLVALVEWFDEDGEE